MRKYLGAVVVLALSGVAIAADVDGKKLTGKWESKGEKDTLVIEFKAKDKVKVTHTVGDKEAKAEGTYKLDGDKLTIKVKVKDEEKTHSVTVAKLTDDTLEVEPKEGEKRTFKRVKEK